MPLESFSFDQQRSDPASACCVLCPVGPPTKAPPTHHSPGRERLENPMRFPAESADHFSQVGMCELGSGFGGLGFDKLEKMSVQCSGAEL